MGLFQFLNALAESGSVIVTQDFREEVEPEAEEVLKEMDRLYRSHLPGKAPDFVPEAALWGAKMLYRGCQFLVCRDIDGDIVSKAMQEACPLPHSPATDYSVDLTFRFLPDLIGMTRGVSSGDPLLQALLKIATEWPLSSVGVTGVEGVNVSHFISDRCLRQLYIDRILERNDLTRLGSLEVNQAIKESLGAHVELCPTVAEKMQSAMTATSPD
ncbi:hypothetical protein [Pedosphaera parvula]|uniref:MoxR-vWA-beta-propeller ternary system domain-containing protein n=1 Tax=Pedosphaera parvula (strain Ellin514) TaxID=320771 RepID=B9XN87_PEDPL|nr:hypothetical protein [Pedosphaera parvula]EEF58749.1 hypothetical protein Cflav_PD1845 [Pedosphaera parvula Ellin514]